MTKSKILTQPLIKNEYLDTGEMMQKVTFLKIPSDIDEGSLTNYIGIGGVHFQEVRNIARKDKKSKYIMVTTNNREQGLLAISYLAAIENQKRQSSELDEYLDDEEEEYENEEIEESFDEIKKYKVHEDKYSDYENQADGEDDIPFENEYGYGWEESKYKIPIIDSVELKNTLDLNRQVFGRDNYAFTGRGKSDYVKPYWLFVNRESICIEYLSSIFGEADIGEEVTYFDSCRTVYLLNVEYKMPPEGCNDWKRDKLNLVKMDLLADEITLRIKFDESTLFFKYLFEMIVHEYHLRFSKSFPKEKIVNYVLNLKNEDKCQLFHKFIGYAMKDWDESHSRTITDKDFAFLKQFHQKASSQNMQQTMERTLYGLDQVKRQVYEVIDGMKFQMEREKMGLPGSGYHNVHMMIGAPGTAKTTTAKLMGQMMVNEKLLPGNRFICVNAAELKGKYVGQSAPKTKKIIEQHDVIVIDEAYALVPSGTEMDSFSEEVIAQLIVEMENHATDKLIIFAGYGGKDVSHKNDRMKQFLNANPGIKSRINSTIYFESYTPQEMMEITRLIAESQQFQVSPNALPYIKNYFSVRVKDQNFGNGREARSLVENAVVFAGNRVMKKKKRTKEDYTKLTALDFRKAIQRAKQANRIQTVHMKKQVGFKV